MINTIKNKFRRWNLTNQTVRELSRLSNRELNDIGISRTDIKTIAKEQLF